MGRMEDSAREENMLSAIAAGRGRYTKADMEALCQTAVAGALKGAELQTQKAVAEERERCAMEVWYTLQKFMDDPDDDGVEHWLREAEKAIRARGRPALSTKAAWPFPGDVPAA